LENFDKYRKLLDNGLFLSHHAQEELKEENISLEDIRKTILEGSATFDHSNQNDKSHAWNKKPHIAFSSKTLNLTAIVCESLESGILLCSAFHGEAHNYFSNPYHRKFNY
jgi:hypothetical protein